MNKTNSTDFVVQCLQNATLITVTGIQAAAAFLRVVGGIDQVVKPVDPAAEHHSLPLAVHLRHWDGTDPVSLGEHGEAATKGEAHINWCSLLYCTRYVLNIML